jgi:hypothetical protein
MHVWRSELLKNSGAQGPQDLINFSSTQMQDLRRSNAIYFLVTSVQTLTNSSAITGVV